MGSAGDTGITGSVGWYVFIDLLYVVVCLRVAGAQSSRWRNEVKRRSTIPMSAPKCAPYAFLYTQRDPAMLPNAVPKRQCEPYHAPRPNAV